MASSQCTAASCTRCMTPASAPTAAMPSRRARLPRPWVTITPTVTRPSTTPSCVWPSLGRCATRWWTDRATSAHRVTTRRPPCVTPRLGSRRWPWRCCVKSMRKQSISFRTTTAASWSRRCCRAGFRTCWPTVRAVSPSVWPPTCRRTTCVSWPKPSTGRWTTTRRTRRPLSRRSAKRSPVPTSRRRD
ncbi:Uncharacterised protein [Mycobacteroides abscessus subsp. abscessus]|nr:Uncharacterised protein [Mycobacteroides abscessus subsp. abscessus]